MPVLAVNPNLFTKKQNQNYHSNSIQKNMQQPQSNLINLNYGANYGQLLVNKNISFGSSPVEAMDLTKKVSIAANILGMNDILLLGKDLESAKKDLKSGLAAFSDVIKKITFIKDEGLKTTIAIKKSNLGLDRMINLGNDPIFVNHQNKPEMNMLLKGNVRSLIETDLVTTSNTDVSFSINHDIAGKISDIPKDLVREFDFSGNVRDDIKKINEKVVKLLDKVDKPAILGKKVMFADVGGQDEAIAEIKKKVLLQIKYPNFFANNLEGGHGTLFVGPPGNGKSRAALALANETGIPFYSLNGQLLESKWIGESASKAHEYYENAKANQPCIIFFDEINSILSKRTGEYPYRDQQVEVHLDEISKLEQEGAQVYLIGATNHPDLMDEAALRRFDTKIEFTNLDTPERCQAVFDVHAKSVAVEDLDKDIFMQKICKANLSGSDIANLVKEAKMVSIDRQGIFESMASGTFKDEPGYRLSITGEDLEKALEKLIKQRNMLGGYSKHKTIQGLTPDPVR